MSSTPRAYSAVAFHKSFPGGTARGRLRIEGGVVRFESDEGQPEIALPVSGLTARRGGATGDHIYFSHPSLPDWTLTTADTAVETDPALLAEPAVARHLGRVKRSRHLVLVGCLSLLLLLAAGVAALFMFKEALVTAAAEQIPPSWEAKMGETAFQQVKATTALLDDPALKADLERLAEPLLSSIPDKRWKYQLHLADAKDPNAFALPGGIIVVHSGLILSADRPEEVLGVLAHEIAHVSRRHGTRQLLSRAGLWLIIQGVIGDVQGLAGYLVDSGAFLLTQQYSRDYEREADETGWQYLTAAGIDPSGLADFFRRMKRLEETGAAASMPAILSTHPATDERLGWLEEQERKSSGGEAGTARGAAEFEAFKQRLAVRAKQK